MKRKILTTIAFVGTFIIGVSIGTSANDDAPEAVAPPIATETVTETATETVAVAPEPEPAPTPEPELVTEVELDEDLTALVMETVWSDIPAAEQDEMCLGWALVPDAMLDSFMEGAGEDFDRTQVRDFFDGECL